MSDTRTISMLRRLPVILAVTAASYGLPYQAHAATRQAAAPGGKLSASAPPARPGAEPARPAAPRD